MMIRRQSTDYVAGLAVFLGLAACSYDFDAPFASEARGDSGTEAGTGGSSGASAGAGGGVGGSGGFGGSSGDGGAGTGGGSAATGGSAGAGGMAGAGGSAGTSGMAGAGGAAGASGSGGCPASSHVCIDQPSPPWEGPVVLVVASTSPVCPSSYPVEVLQTHRDLSFDDASCSCTCTDVQGVDCSDIDLVYRYSCAQPIGSESLTSPGACQDVTPMHNSNSVVVNEDTSNAHCQPVPSTTTPPVELLTSLTGCAGASFPPGCDTDEICAPKASAPFESLCIFIAGDAVCPSGYPDKQIAYETLSDTRGCSPCSCNGPTGVGCETTFLGYSDANCTAGETVLAAGMGECYSAVSSIYFDPPVVTGSCQPGDVNPTGTVELTDQITICCTES